MRASGLSLIGATVVLACLDAVLATRLFHERRQSTHAVQERRVLEQQITELRHPTGVLVGALALAPAPTAGTPSQAETPAAKRLAWLRKELRKLTDPERREARLFEQKSEMREYHSGLALELHLSPTEADAVFDCLADQYLRHEEYSLRDAMAGGDGWRDETVLDEKAREQLVKVLGASRFDELLGYFDGFPERRRLAGLQTRLGATNALQADQTAQLRDVMREERDRLSATVAGLGTGVHFLNGYPEDARRFGSDRTSQLRFDDEQIARVIEHYERIRERASQFMTPQQVRRLKEQQQTKLVSMQRLLMQRRRVDAEVAEMRRQGAQQ